MGLILERDRLEVFDLLIFGETPDADMAAAQVAVLIPVQRDGGALVVDLPALREDAKSGGDAFRTSDHDLARLAADGAQPVADGGPVDAARGLGRECERDSGVIGLLDVDEHR